MRAAWSAKSARNWASRSASARRSQPSATAYTHFRITLYAFACEIVRGEPQAIGCAAWTWASLDELDRYAFPVTDQQIIAQLRNGGQLAFDWDM